MLKNILKGLLLGFLLVNILEGAFAQSSSGRRDYSESESFFPNLKGYKESKGPKGRGKVENSADLPVQPGVSSVWLNFSVFDKNGNYISGITQNEIEVFVDEKEVTIEELGASAASVDVIFLIDASPSFRNQLSRVATLIEKTVAALAVETRVSLVCFNEKFEILLGPTLDRKAVAEALARLRFEDGTSLYDAVDRTVLSLEGHRERPRTVVLITDGVDTTSKGSFESSLANTYRSNATFWSVYLNTLSPSPQSIMPPGSAIPAAVLRGMANDQNKKEHERGRDYVQKVVRMTGGSSFVFPRRESGIGELATKLGTAIKDQYAVKLKMEGLNFEESLQKFRVRVVRKDLQILVKSGAEIVK